MCLLTCKRQIIEFPKGDEEGCETEGFIEKVI